MPKEPKISTARSQTIEEQRSALRSIFDWAKKRARRSKKRKEDR